MIMVREYTGRDSLSEPVARAVSQVERHLFVPEKLRPYAYDNGPLPIGEGQTISQPFIVALMTELLDVDEDSRVLEVGTGSGYQAAVLAKIVNQVYSVEINEHLAQEAGERLER
ncbi:MAG: protein-L-isoaspartate O-methyltransferase, partial [Pseudomonadales bacterium]|nr:protein-L-isoaspartate O-methyltransferase [Pseudomonadales bacterium]